MVIIVAGDVSVSGALIARQFPRARHTIVLGGSLHGPVSLQNEYGTLQIHMIPVTMPAKKSLPAIDQSTDSECPDGENDIYLGP